MQKKRNPYITGRAYHIMNLSIAGYKVFPKDEYFKRLIQSMRYNQHLNIEEPFSHFISLNSVVQNGISSGIQKRFHNAKRKIDIMAYCVMSTHFHIVCRQLVDGGIALFLNQVLNGYTHYFNKRHNRKGPLWIASTKKVPIYTDEHLDFVIRYVHLNPTTAYLVDKPEDWAYTSYHEYLNKVISKDQFCQKFYLEKNWQKYKESVDARIERQREISTEKKYMDSVEFTN